MTGSMNYRLVFQGKFINDTISWTTACDIVDIQGLFSSMKGLQGLIWFKTCYLKISPKKALILDKI